MEVLFLRYIAKGHVFRVWKCPILVLVLYLGMMVPSKPKGSEEGPCVLQGSEENSDSWQEPHPSRLLPHICLHVTKVSFPGIDL